ncbi:MAG: DNA-formamidopyrimidine glycosylase, partial [Kiritimatiellae bacterium]|nr:DNA-formamidopyrimidine glycosylase [Kiritimatiellia bacterium]
MPELPEVETVVHSLRAAGLVGHTITGAHVLWKRSVATPSPAAFVRTVSGLQIGGVSRRGKFIVFALSKGWKLLIHLRMSGRIEVARDLRARAGAARRVPPKRLREGGRSAPTYTRLLLTLDDGRELRFKDTRKFGRVWLVEDAQGVLGRLGPEPLSLSVTGFWSLITDHSRLLKPLILDQSFLAGIGNIYVDEALWEARLHPLRKSDTLTRAEAECLLKAIKTVLRRGIRNLGTTLGKGH